MEALRNLEKGPKTITASTMRSLRKLLTPQARADIIPALTGTKRPQLQEMERAIDQAARQQWLDFQWSKDNEFLKKDMGVCHLPLPPPLRSSARAHLRAPMAYAAHDFRFSGCLW